MSYKVVTRFLMVNFTWLSRNEEWRICDQTLRNYWYWCVFVWDLNVALLNREINWFFDLLAIGRTNSFLFWILFSLQQIETFRFTKQILIEMRSCYWYTIRRRDIFKRMRIVSLQPRWENFAGSPRHCLNVMVDQTPITGFLSRSFELVQRFGCASQTSLAGKHSR
jgi:hypothetical protein